MKKIWIIENEKTSSSQNVANDLGCALQQKGHLLASGLPWDLVVRVTGSPGFTSVFVAIETEQNWVIRIPEKYTSVEQIMALPIWELLFKKTEWMPTQFNPEWLELPAATNGGDGYHRSAGDGYEGSYMTGGDGNC